MIYYLIIMICTGDVACAWNSAVTVATIEFNNLESCQEAGENIIKNAPKNSELGVVCVGDIKEII